MWCKMCFNIPNHLGVAYECDRGQIELRLAIVWPNDACKN